ncbi:MAG: metallophosphoesterase [Clostridia bacterium]|nr:metallophosphoesterase [Clostridia bacterium]
MKKLLCVLLSCLMLASVFAPAALAADDAFVPVLRFIASSDSHIRSDSDMTSERIGKMLSEVYAVADADGAYGALDALLMAGDLTNDGTKEEFVKYWAAVSGALREGTEYLGVVAKNHDGYVMPRRELRRNFAELTGLDADFHKVINGFHFIGLSASDTDGIHYTRKQLNWLREQLDAAVAEDPAKPVFFMHHEHNRNTVYGSSSYDGWGVTFFNKILDQYPQVVDFSGHSHYPLNDPRSLWQGKYTAIGTGAIYYSEFTIDDVRTYHPADSDQTATCWIVEVDAANRLRLRGWDIEADRQLCEYVLDNPADPANREYTPEKQAARSKAPVFASGAALQIEPVKGGCRVLIPAAESADGMPVVLYRVSAVNKNGVEVEKQWALPHYYVADGPEETECTLDGLTTGEYTIRVVAETAYGVQSEPLTEKTEVDGENAFVGFFLYLGRLFRQLFAAIRLMFA